MKDLTEMVEDIVNVLKSYGFENPAIGVCFTLPIDRKRVHWVTNVSREDGIKLFTNTALAMAQSDN